MVNMWECHFDVSIWGTLFRTISRGQELAFCPPKLSLEGREIAGVYRLGCYGFAPPSQTILTLRTAPNQNPSDPYPSGIASKRATLDVIARVTTNGQPKAGVSVNFGVSVEPQTGGHEHHDVNRPKGSLSAVQGTTDANGEVKLTFTAPEVAGIHTVKATCATCSNSPAVKEIKVKVPDLIQIPADTQTPPRYVLVGQRSEHRKSHFVTEAGLDVLNQVIRAFARLGWGQVGINDASLEWGGMFDIEGKWLKPYMNNKGKWVTGGHAEHRNGEQVDISFARPASVSMQLRKKAYREVCNNNRTSLSPDILWHENDGYAPHFHIYLTGKAGAPAAGKNNQCTEK